LRLQEEDKLWSGFFGHLLISPSLRTINLVPAQKIPDLDESALED